MRVSRTRLFGWSLSVLLLVVFSVPSGLALAEPLAEPSQQQDDGGIMQAGTTDDGSGDGPVQGMRSQGPANGIEGLRWLEKPQIYPEEPNHIGFVGVSMSNPNALGFGDIFYTLNGESPEVTVDGLIGIKPKNSSTQKYTGPFILEQSTTVKAKVFGKAWGLLESKLQEKAYTIAALQAPTGLSVAGRGSDFLKFSFTGSEGATGYKVYFNGGIQELAAGVTGFELSGLTPGTEYTVEISAVKAEDGVSIESARSGGPFTTLAEAGLCIEIIGQGEVEVNPPANSEGKYAEGTEVVLVPRAYAGWRFVKWEDDTDSNPRTITTGSTDTTITAVFEKIQQTAGYGNNDLVWQRSIEPADRCSGGEGCGWNYAEAAQIPLVNSVTWDGGTGDQFFSGYSSRDDIGWASWGRVTDGADLRRFKADFILPADMQIDSARMLSVDAGTTIPINDNIYVYVNGTLAFWGGTRVKGPGAVFDSREGMQACRDSDSQSRFSHTDGWYIHADVNFANLLVSGQENTIDVFTEEYDTGGGMSKLLLNINRKPAAADDAYTVKKGEVLAITSPGVLGNDSDPDGDGLRAVLTEGPQNGSLNLHEDGSFTYTPNPDFSGADTFTYKASDGKDCSSIAAVAITVISDGLIGGVKVIKTIGNKEGQPQAGVKFNLYQGEQKAMEGTTDSNGFCIFSSLPIGSYRLYEEVPDGYSTSIPGGIPVEVFSGETTSVCVVNTEIPDEIVYGSIIVYKFWENDEEPRNESMRASAWQGVTFKLFKDGEEEAYAVQTTTIDGEGHETAVFSELPAGRYRLEEVVPEGYRSSIGEGYSFEIPEDGSEDEMNRSVRVENVLLPYYTLRISQQGQGTVFPQPGIYSYREREKVQLAAAAASGWRFAGWQGDTVGADGKIVMDANKSVTAVFALIDTTPADGEGDNNPPPAPTDQTPRIETAPDEEVPAAPVKKPKEKPADKPSEDKELPEEQQPEDRTQTTETAEEEPVPAGASKLPKTGGIPAGLFYAVGGVLTLAGIALKKRR